MDDFPKNRLRTLSNLRTEDSFVFKQLSMLATEELLEDNDEEYAQSGLESVLKSTSLSLKYQDYMRKLEEMQSMD